MDVGESAHALQLGERDAYLAPSGASFCVHKKRLVSMTKTARPYIFKSRGRCECALTLPRRAPKVGLSVAKRHSPPHALSLTKVERLEGG